MKYYKIQALYVPSIRNKPSEKYLIKVTGPELSTLVLDTQTQLKLNKFNLD